jgi:hypothetical protein
MVALPFSLRKMLTGFVEAGLVVSMRALQTSRFTLGTVQRWIICCHQK